MLVTNRLDLVPFDPTHLLALIREPEGFAALFGHPAAEVVERYRVRAIALESSPHCGAAAWQSTQPGHLRCERESAPRYWRHRAPAPIPRTN